MPFMTPAAEDNPFAKKFMVDPIRQNRLGADFYGEKDRLTTAVKDAGEDTADSVTKRYMNKVAGEISDINKEIREIELSDMTGAEKKAAIREKRAVINELERDALRNLKDYEAAAERAFAATGDVDKAYDMANREVFGADYVIKMMSDSAQEKAEVAKKAGISGDVFLDAYEVINGMEADKDGNGESISGSKKKKVATYIESLDITKEQKETMFQNIAEYDGKNMPEFSDGSNKDDSFSAEYDISSLSQAAQEKAKAAMDAGISGEAFYHIYDALGDFKADKDENGKTISGSKKEKVVDYIESLDLSRKQKEVLYRDVAKYDVDTMPSFSNGGSVTPGESAGKVEETSYSHPIADGTLVTQGFGVANDRYASGRHNAIDFRAPSGTKVKAAEDGKVVYVGTNGAWGRRVVVEHADGHYTAYNHLSAFGVEKGEEVNAGTVIGKSGGSGIVGGVFREDAFPAHLDFEVYDGSYTVAKNRVDPNGYYDFGANSTVAEEDRGNYRKGSDVAGSGRGAGGRSGNSASKSSQSGFGDILGLFGSKEVTAAETASSREAAAAELTRWLPGGRAKTSVQPPAAAKTQAKGTDPSILFPQYATEKRKKQRTGETPRRNQTAETSATQATGRSR